MPEIQCPVTGCTHTIPDHEPVLQAAMLNAHVTGDHSTPVQQPLQPRRGAPKVERPRLTDNMGDVGWNAFLQDWETFIRANGVTEEDQPIQLFSCCNGELKTKVSSICQKVYEKTVPELMKLLKDLAVIPVATTVKCNELLQMRQSAGESIRAFHSRVKGKAVTCQFTVKCQHEHTPDAQGQPRVNLPVDYTERMIRHVILNGLYDADISRDIISMSDVDDVTNDALIARIEAKETAREATSATSNTSAVSQYKRNQKLGKQNVSKKPTSVDCNLEGKCPSCNTKYKLFKIMRSGKPNTKAFSHCWECWKKEKTDVNEVEAAKEEAIEFAISSVVTTENEATPSNNEAVPNDDTKDESPTEVKKKKRKKKKKKKAQAANIGTSSNDNSLEADITTDGTLTITTSPYDVPTVPVFADDDDEFNSGSEESSMVDAKVASVLAESETVTNEMTGIPLYDVRRRTVPAFAYHNDGPNSGSVGSLVVDTNVTKWVEYDGVSLLDVHTEINVIKSQEIVLSHHIFKNGNWIPKQKTNHPKVTLEARTEIADYRGFGFEQPIVSKFIIEAVVDSGAQCCVWGWDNCQLAGFKREDLIPVKQKLNGVSKSSIEIYGAVVLRMCGVSSSTRSIQCAAIVYVSPNISGFYLSEEAMKQLHIIPKNFPTVGSALPMSINSAGPVEGQCKEECTCLPRSATPGRPDKLPFDAIPENVDKMKEYLLNRYASSTFNKCPHHKIPEILGPPISIHIDPEATPVCVNVPSQVPIHLEYEVNKGLDEDEAMGIIEKVPHNEPSEWCHRMVLARKDSGGVRRTVDLSPLNQHCMREVHAMRSPFELAKGVPARTWRTVSDAWNSFHGLPLREKDRPLTTFITHRGRYRYKRAPQGYASSGDGYNRRMDEILTEFPRHKRCVDDNLTYDEDMEQHWWRIIDFLELMERME